MECVCDYEWPDFYSRTTHKARKPHRCYECFRMIEPGEQYEKVAYKYDGDIGTYPTCWKCLAVREWVKAHVPCFCWMHGSMLDDAQETVEHYAHEAPGLLFGFLRRRHKPERYAR